MYASYVKEKEGLETLQTEVGFGAYSISPVAKIFEIGDFYIKPEFRTGRHSTKLFKELVDIAKKANCTKITCCVETSHNKPEPYLYAVLRNGFKFSHICDDIIYFYQNI